jgi:hypothetical protein
MNANDEKELRRRLEALRLKHNDANELSLTHDCLFADLIASVEILARALGTTPANEVQNAERAQYEATIEQQRAKIEELEKQRSDNVAKCELFDDWIAVLRPLRKGDERYGQVLDRLVCGDSASKRIAELEAQLASEIKERQVCQGNMRELEKSQAELTARIADLLQLLDDATAVPTADGKAPGQVAFEAWTSAFVALYGGKPVKWDPPLANIWDPTAQAVLRAFGQNAAEALERVRDVLCKRPALNLVFGIEYVTIPQVRAAFDSKLAELGGKTKPPTDHAHEVGSCTHCDTRGITDTKPPTKPLVGELVNTLGQRSNEEQVP